MAKGLYIRRVHKFDTCEKKGFKEKAVYLVDDIFGKKKEREVLKLCKEHADIKGKKDFGPKNQCTNCGCWRYN